MAYVHFTGTAQAGGANTLTLAAGSLAPRDSGAYLRLVSGAGSVQERAVTAYDDVTKVATVVPWAFNHYSYSNDPSHASWSKSNVTVETAAAVRQDGTTWNRLTDTSSVAQASISKNIVALPSTQYCASISLKADTHTGLCHLGLYFPTATVKDCSFRFNYTTGEVTNKSVNVDGDVEVEAEAGGGWRVKWKGTSLADTDTCRIYCYITNSADVSLTGSIYWAHAQLKPATGHGDYIETGATPVLLPDSTTVYECLAPDNPRKRLNLASAFPAIPKDVPLGLKRFLEKVKELLELRNAQVGSPLDANPTYRDLIATGLIKVTDDAPLLAAGREFRLDTRTWLTSNIPEWVTDTTNPPVPTGFTVTTNASTITLFWDDPAFANYKQTLVYRAASNNLSAAEIIGSNTGNTYVDDLPPEGTQYYYWIRHESRSELRSDFNSTNGTTVSNTPAQPTVSHVFSGENLVLSWTTPTSNLTIQYYEVSYGASPGGNPVGIAQTNTLRVRADFSGARTYWVRAVDVNGNFGTAGSRVVTVTAPGQPSIAQTLTGVSLAISITAGTPGSLPIAYYDIRHGASWAAGTPLGLSSATRYEFEVNWTGSRTFHVVAFDTAGNQSTAGSSTFTLVPGVVNSVTPQVIDNHVLLQWASTPGTLPVKTYNVYRGATLIGTSDTLFSAVFESLAGTYVYKVEPVDSAGNVGTFATATTVVAAPPDFILFDQLDSDFSGTKTTCWMDPESEILYANVDPTETFQDHFTTRGWSTPQDQITAGYPLFLVGKTTGSYLEKVDYGTTVPSTKITMTPTNIFTNGTVTQAPTISTSPDDVGYTDFAGVFSAFGTAFQYVKYKIDFTAVHDGTGLAADTSNLIGIKPLRFTLDLKLKTFQGVVAAAAADVGGTSVDITGLFLDVQAIQLTPLSLTAKHPTYDFTDVPNPTSFKVLLWDAAGSRVSGDVSWTLRGV